MQVVYNHSMESLCIPLSVIHRRDAIASLIRSLPHDNIKRFVAMPDLYR